MAHGWRGPRRRRRRNWRTYGGTKPQPQPKIWLPPAQDTQEVPVKIKYEAEITGDCAPYKWEVKNPNASMYTSAAKVKTKSGEADSYEDAVFAASQAAHEFEAERRHKAAVRKVVLFEVSTASFDDDVDPLELDVEVADRED